MSTIYKPSKTLLAAAIGLSFAFSGTAFSADRMSTSEYNESVSSTKAEYNSALKACGDTRGAERTACRKEARTKRDSMMSEARAKRGPATSRSDRMGRDGATVGAGPKSTNETAGSSTGGQGKVGAREGSMNPMTPKSSNESAGTMPGEPGKGGSMARRDSRGAGTSAAPVTTPKSPNETAPTK